MACFVLYIRLRCLLHLLYVWARLHAPAFDVEREEEHISRHISICSPYVVDLNGGMPNYVQTRDLCREMSESGQSSKFPNFAYRNHHVERVVGQLCGIVSSHSLRWHSLVKSLPTDWAHPLGSRRSLATRFELTTPCHRRKLSKTTTLACKTTHDDKRDGDWLGQLCCGWFGGSCTQFI